MSKTKFLSRYQNLNIILFLLAIGVSFFITSCDPAKTITICNLTNQNINITIQQDSTSDFLIGTKENFEYELNKSGKNSILGFYYGFGVFSEKELLEFNSSIRSISIASEVDTCIFQGNDLLNILPKKRLGILNNMIHIKLKNCSERSH